MSKTKKKTSAAAGWNYRIMRHKNTVKVGPKKTKTLYWWAIHEVYYSDGKPDGWTVEPKAAFGLPDDETKPDDKAGAKAVIRVLRMMLRDAIKSQRDVMDFHAKP